MKMVLQLRQKDSRVQKIESVRIKFHLYIFCKYVSIISDLRDIRIYIYFDFDFESPGIKLRQLQPVMTIHES